MHILLIGASGRTGKLVLSEALKRGHTVTALVRNESSLEPRTGLTIVQGNPLNVADIERAVTVNDAHLMPSAAIVTLASVRASDSPFAKQVSPPRLLADSNKNVVEVLKRHGIKKIVTLSAVGVGDSWAQMPTIIAAMMSCSNMKYAYEDHNLVDQEMRTSGMDYVLVRPTRLVYGEDVKPVKNLGNEGKGQSFMSSTTTGSLAVFLVDAVESTELNGTTPVITN